MLRRHCVSPCHAADVRVTLSDIFASFDAMPLLLPYCAEFSLPLTLLDEATLSPPASLALSYFRCYTLTPYYDAAARFDTPRRHFRLRLSALSAAFLRHYC